MSRYMENIKSNQEAEHFIMLDVLDTANVNEFDRSHPYVQIIYPSDMNSYFDNKAAESHPENGLTHRERKKYFFTISLNVDADH